MENSAIELLTIDDFSTITVNKKALNLLNTYRDPICVMGSTGTPKSGKSSFLNDILQSNEFRVGHTVEPTTKGIWMSRHLCTENFNIPILIFDCEASGNVGSDPKMDAILLSILSAVCNVVVYHCPNALNEREMERISICARLIQTLKNGNEEDVGCAHLLWVLRDFYLRLDEGCTPQMYLDRSLENNNPEGNNGNETKAAVRNLFPQQSCVSLPPRGRSLGNDSTFFTESLKEVVKPHLVKLLNNVHKKCISGPLLASTLEHMVEEVNSTKTIPNLSYIWGKVISATTRKCFKAGMELYTSTTTNEVLQKKGPIPFSKLIKIHKKAKCQALDVFTAPLLSNLHTENSLIEKYKVQLQEEIKQAFQDLKLLNEQRTDDLLRNLVYDDFKKLAKNVDDHANIEDLNRMWDCLTKKLEDAWPYDDSNSAKVHKEVTNEFRQVFLQHHFNMKTSFQKALKQCHMEAAEIEGRDSAQIRVLVKQNSELKGKLDSLTKTNLQIYDIRKKLQSAEVAERQLREELKILKERPQSQKSPKESYRFRRWLLPFIWGS